MEPRSLLENLWKSARGSYLADWKPSLPFIPQVAKVLEFSFNISPSNEYSGPIYFRMDWLDLLAVQWTLKSLLQHHSSKASILWHSAFFIVQLSHPYMTTDISPEILIPASASSSPAYLMIYSAYKLSNQGDNIQPWLSPFPVWNQCVVPCPVLTVASWSAYRFLKRQVRWSGIPVSLINFHSLLWLPELSNVKVIFSLISLSPRNSIWPRAGGSWLLSHASAMSGWG